MLANRVIASRRKKGIQYVGYYDSGSISNTGSNYTLDFGAVPPNPSGIGVGGGLQSGDLVVIVSGWISTSFGFPTVLTSGFTNVVSGMRSSTRGINFAVDYKIMGPSPDYVITVKGSSISGVIQAARATVWRGVNPSTPLDVTTAQANDVGSSQWDPPAITPVTTGAVILMCGGHTGANNFSQGLHSPPVGVTPLTNIGAFDNINNTPFLGLYQAANLSWVSGSYNAGMWSGSLSSAQDAWYSATLALRPA